MRKLTEADNIVILIICVFGVIAFVIWSTFTYELEKLNHDRIYNNCNATDTRPVSYGVYFSSEHAGTARAYHL